MKYYCLTVDKRYSNLPVIKNWYGKIERENIREDRSYLLPQRELLELTENKNVFFADVLVTPFFLVSDLCKEVISMYEPKTKYKRIVLLDTKTSKHQVYNLPILKRVNGITEQKQVGNIRITEEKLKVHEGDVKGLAFSRWT